MNFFLLLLFFAHFCVFLGFYIRRKHPKYLLLTGIFGTLIVSVACRIFLPDFLVSGFHITLILRYSAIFLSFISVSFFLLGLLRKKEK
jgi:hypothetical protein